MTDMSAVTSNTTVSNFDSLDTDTKHFLKLFHEKQELLAKVFSITQELNTLNATLLDRMTTENKPTIQLCPSKEEEKIFGAMGSLTIKMKNDFEYMSYMTMSRLIAEFFEYLLKPGDATKNLSEGMMAWLWNHRKRTPVRYLERTFVEKPTPRKRTADPEAPKAIRKPRPKISDNIPQTREEFLAIPNFREIITSGSIPVEPVEDDTMTQEQPETEEM